MSPRPGDRTGEPASASPPRAQTSDDHSRFGHRRRRHRPNWTSLKGPAADGRPRARMSFSPIVRPQCLRGSGPSRNHGGSRLCADVDGDQVLVIAQRLDLELH
jgi:hypothetical protein